MRDLNNLDLIVKEIKKNALNVIYFSTSTCNVCKTLKPKIKDFLNDFPKTNLYYVDLDKLPKASGHFTIFTVPTIIVFADGKETLRESRHISIREFDNIFSRLYNMLFDQ